MRYACMRYACLRYTCMRYECVRYACVRYACMRYACMRYACMAVSQSDGHTGAAGGHPATEEGALLILLSSLRAAHTPEENCSTAAETPLQARGEGSIYIELQ